MALERQLGKEILASALDALEHETPRAAYRTNDRYKVIIENRSGTTIRGQFFHGHVFFFPTPGVLEHMTYRGLEIVRPSPPFIGYLDFGDYLVPIGRTTQENKALEDMTWGYTFNGQPHVIYPFRSKDEATLMNRLEGQFARYAEFVGVGGCNARSRFALPLFYLHQTRMRGRPTRDLLQSRTLPLLE